MGSGPVKRMALSGPFGPAIFKVEGQFKKSGNQASCKNLRKKSWYKLWKSDIIPHSFTRFEHAHNYIFPERAQGFLLPHPIRD